MSKLTPIKPEALFDSSTLGFSQGVLDQTSGLAFFSGQVGCDKSFNLVSDDFAGQAEQAFKNLETALEETGSGTQSLVYMRINIRGECEDHMGALSPLLGKFLGDSKPAITVAGVSSLFSKAALIEIEAVSRPD